MTPYTEINQAIAAINAWAGAPQDFALPLSDSLLDPMGMNMAIITDWILRKGWEPDGYDQGSGYRVYRYRAGA